MKYFVILSLLLLVGGCGGGEKEDTESQGSSKTELVQHAADTLTAQFMKDLKSELMAAMQEGGPTNAIAVCNVRAPEIAAAHSEAGVWSIKRVTDQPRNPENKADDHELSVLVKFKDSTNQVQAGYGEWHIGETGDTTFMYYKPIRTADLCLKCHGTEEQLDEPVRARLRELYPNDQATGYESGDLRGMFVVTMQWPEAQTEARNLVEPAPAH